MVVGAVLVNVVGAPLSAVPVVASARSVQQFRQVYWTIPW